MDSGPDLLIARAFPGLTAQEVATVSRVFDLLQVAITFSTPPQKVPKLVVPLDSDNDDDDDNDSNHEDQHNQQQPSLCAEFDVDLRKWKLKKHSSAHAPHSAFPADALQPRPRSGHDSPHSLASKPPSEVNVDLSVLEKDGAKPPSEVNVDLSALEEDGRIRGQDGDEQMNEQDEAHENGQEEDAQIHKEMDEQRNEQHRHDTSKEDEDQGEQGVDWTLRIPPSAHNQFLLDTAWDKTALGPMSKWPLVLRLMTLKMLRDPRPANLYWGAHRVAIYNEAFSVIASSRHPAMMGATAEDAMPATWPFLKIIMQEVEDSGKAFSMPQFEMEVHKADGFLEEAWYDGVFSPITDTRGNFVGIYNSGDEVSNVVLPRRYARLIHQIAAIPDFAKTITTPWQHIIQSCSEFERDVPMLLVYSADMKMNNAKSDDCILHLEGSLGMGSSNGQEVIPQSLNLSESNHPLAQAFNSSKALRSSLLLDMPAGQAPDFMSQTSCRGWPESSTHIPVMPIFASGLIAGFMVMGLNPRRPYDNELKQLVNDVWRAAASVVSSSISSDQAREREKTLARELTQRERFIRKMAEVATAGIYSLSDAGTLTYANARYHDVVHTPAGLESGQPVGFEQYILDDDLAKITEAHDKCKSEQKNITINVRLKKTWVPPGGSAEQPCWVMNSIIPDIEDGQVRGVIGSMADICHTMWALQLQKDSTQAALDSKQHLERFIDMTSHEMRNPLGVTLQCADDVIRSIAEGLATFADVKDLHHFLESIRENAKTISFCSAHQKSIADDILVASKLSSSLMSLSPTACQPEAVAKEVMQMFKSEAANEKIEMKLELQSSYIISWVLCDAPRLRQVLINLLTNAVKFTKGRSKPRIEVIMGNSKVAPPSNMQKLIWHPEDSPPPPGISDESEVFLTFEVRDTGKGLNEEEMSRLFNRFSQANAKTSHTYGGSGLGLFISMELAGLQGGRIGLASKEGEGSTFGFYIKVKKTKADEQEIQDRRRILETPHTAIPVPSQKEHLDILLVEDNVLNQRVLKKQLHQKGHCVHIANHGVEALDYLKTTRFWRDNKGSKVDVDVILMDWEMPVMNGIECTKKIREFERQGFITEHLPIIVTSANSRAEQQEEAFAAGTDKFLSKPFLVKPLLEMIRSFGT